MPKFSHRIFSVLLLFVLFFFSSANLYSAEWKLITPTQGKKAKLRIEKKTRSYWELEHKDPVKVEVTGPTTLKVITRGVLGKKQKDVLYGLVAYLDGKERFFVGRGSSRSKSVSNTKIKSQRIAESRSIEFDVPAGEHVYSFSLPSSVKNPVFVRFLIPDQSEEEINYIAYLPHSYLEEVRLAIKEREYIYYRSNDANPVEIEVIGPTRIRGVARLEFDHTIRGDKPYRVQVKENGKVVMTRPITAQVSGTATYMDPSTRVPARGESFHIDVPEGKHRYEIFTPDPGLSVLFRFYIPQRDLGNVDHDKEKTHASFLGS